jgi:hypothetical protein
VVGPVEGLPDAGGFFARPTGFDLAAQVLVEAVDAVVDDGYPYPRALVAAADVL